ARRPPVVRAVAASPKPLRARALTADGKQVLTAGADGTARAFNAATGAAGLTFAGGAGPIRAVAVSRDGRLAAVGGERHIRLFTLSDGKPAGSVPVPAEPRALAFQPTTDALAAGGGDRAATVRD